MTHNLIKILYGITLAFLLTACSGGGSEGNNGSGTSTFTVTPAADSNGTISPPAPKSVASGNTVSFTITPETGYSVSSVVGCGGSLSGNIYTTGAISENCTVSAVFSQSRYTVTPTAGDNGTISPNTAQTISHGALSSFTITPNAGYNIVSAAGCNGTLSGSIFTTAPISGDCSVSASFVENQFPVTTLVAAGKGGSILCLPASPVTLGNTVSCTLTPDTGYKLANLLDNGIDVTSGTGVYSISNIAAAHELKATFSFKEYTVTPSAGSNGTISPNTAQTILHGAQSSFTITPNAGYNIVSAAGCDGTLSGSTFTTAPISGDCSVSASFGANQYPLTTRVTSGVGNISCSPASPVTLGSTVSCSLTPSTGYYIATAAGCGGSLSGSTYTTSPVAAACTVFASFSKYITSGTLNLSVAKEPSKLSYLDLEIILPVGVLPTSMSAGATADVFEATSSVTPSPSIATYTASTRTIRMVFLNSSGGIGVGSLASLSLTVAPTSSLTSGSFPSSATIIAAADTVLTDIINASTLIQVPVSLILQ